MRLLSRPNAAQVLAQPISVGGVAHGVDGLLGVEAMTVGTSVEAK